MNSIGRGISLTIRLTETLVLQASGLRSSMKPWWRVKLTMRLQSLQRALFLESKGLEAQNTSVLQQLNMRGAWHVRPQSTHCKHQWVKLDFYAE